MSLKRYEHKKADQWDDNMNIICIQYSHNDSDIRSVSKGRDDCDLRSSI